MEVLLDGTDRDSERVGNRSLVEIGVVTQQHALLLSARQFDDGAEYRSALRAPHIVVDQLVASPSAEPLLGGLRAASSLHLVTSQIQHD